MTPRRVLALAVPLLALAVIVVGLWPRQAPAPATPMERAYELSTRLKCPICVGQSLAESQVEAAKDLKAYIERRIAEGATDEEIIAEFVANYGEQILLDPSGRTWGLLLWVAPGLVLGGGVLVILGRRRRRARVRDTGGPVEVER